MSSWESEFLANLEAINTALGGDPIVLPEPRSFQADSLLMLSAIALAAAGGGGGGGGDSISTLVRQTVMSGPTAWLTVGTGLQVVSQNGAAIATIAKGFDATTGAVNDLFEIPSATSWGSLTASDTVYLWVEWDGSSLSTGHSTLEPAYGATAPTSPASGQWWFDTQAYEGKSWNGSAWVAAPRLYIGQAITDSGSIVEVGSFAFLGRAVGTVTGANSTSAVISHNLGTDSYTSRIEGIFNTAVYGFAIGDRIDISAGFATTSTSSQGVSVVKSINHVDLHFGSGGYQFIRPDVYATVSTNNWNQLDLEVIFTRGF